jgi:glycosyltransferase involved in cell wall biosynthesis
VEQIDPQSYLPPGGSMAFTKDAWESVGGYPEWLTLTGEDTYFDLELKRSTRRWAFAPEAVAGWQAPQSARGWWRKAGYWAAGDGEIGANARAYQRALRQIGFLVLFPLALVLSAIIAALVHSGPLALVMVGMALIWLARIRARTRQVGYSPFLEVGARLAMIAGYLKGLRRRSGADARRWKAVSGIVVILTGVPIDDTGGGARGTQIALELVRHQFLVVFINQFPKYETGGMDVRIGHPNLITLRFGKFRLEDLISQFGDLLGEKPTGILVEHPIPSFLPVVKELRKLGGRVIYDLIDDWNTSLGARWYTPEAEKELIEAADMLLATAPALQARLEWLSGREVVLLPNAVNLLLFDPQRTYPRPADLPAAEWTVIYTGALWGEWFDWGLLIEIARHYPAASVVVIGDYRGQCPETLPNLYFLGLKPQTDLPAYLAYANVAIIPWKVSEITRATSPLKVYEYLAMHKPVVVPDLPLLSGLPFVLPSRSSDEFMLNIEAARQIQAGGEALERFLGENSWQRRVDQIIDIIT